MRRKEIQQLRKLLKQYYTETQAEEALALIRKLRRSSIEPGVPGRKPKYGDSVKETIRSLRAEGKAIRQIARQTGCSTGFVYSTIKEGST